MMNKNSVCLTAGQPQSFQLIDGLSVQLVDALHFFLFLIKHFQL